MAKQGFLRGPKFNMRHTTIIEAALPFVQMLKASPAVKKISLGIIKPVCGGPPRNGGLPQLKAIVLPTAQAEGSEAMIGGLRGRYFVCELLAAS